MSGTEDCRSLVEFHPALPGLLFRMFHAKCFFLEPWEHRLPRRSFPRLPPTPCPLGMGLKHAHSVGDPPSMIVHGT